MTTTHAHDLSRGVLTAITACGGPTALARRIHEMTGEKLTPAAICQWSKVPAERVGQVALASGVAKHVLRPDLHDPPQVIERPVVSTVESCR